MILDKILSHKKREVDRKKTEMPMARLEEIIPAGPPTAGPLSRVLRRPGETTLIAEVKRSSPSKGIIRDFEDPVYIAEQYRQNGAAAISVLTDAKFFGGAPEYLGSIAQAVDLPLLRKDFIIDPYQIYEARALGAAAILLIAAALRDKELLEYMELARSLGLECLTEVHSGEELSRVLNAGSGIIGINNRDLTTFRTDLSTTFKLRPLIKDDDILVVSESGINTRADMIALAEHRIDAALVGEALMRSPDIGMKVRELLGDGQDV